MAIIRTSPIVGAISGTVGSLNFCTGAHGPYVRTKHKAINQGTELQLNRRTSIPLLREQWQGLSQNKRNEWTKTAQQITFANRLGIPRHLSAWQLFLKFALPRFTGTQDFSVYTGSIQTLSPPTGLTVDLIENGLWNLTVPGLPRNLHPRAYVHVSRPVKSHALKPYKYFFYLRNFVMTLGTATFYGPGAPDPRLDGTQADEVVAVMLRWVLQQTDIRCLISTPVIATGTVHV